MFGVSDESKPASPFTSDVDVAVQKFIGDVTKYIEASSPADQSAIAEQCYSIMQQLGEDGKWAKEGPRAVGIPSIPVIATMMFQTKSGETRLVCYPFGGTTQAKSGRIFRSPQFQWFNENPEGEESPGAARVPGVHEVGVGQIVAVLQTSLAARDSTVTSLTERAFRELREERAAGDKRVDMLLGKVLEVVTTIKEVAEETYDRGRNMMADGHDMQVKAMHLETSAHKAERRAILKLEDADKRLQDAEEALESGQTQGWQRLIHDIVTSENGGALVKGIMDRIFAVLDSKLLGSGNSTLQKMGTQDLFSIMQTLELTDAQRGKAMELMQKAFTPDPKKKE